ncbi:hypothetical protein [Cognatishimia sp. F0-27]|uniref:hypothetical protein n=1 Tax=Cognatishimia sp. F0-27 TaxID=2816855 RepID=UPI001D0C3EE4|nr:hypothetical protein [Cognatishimia sp. F0-27]MCC1492724.1 hypothetical protein [Cognatishimia sp. F0-27]
MQVVSPTMVAAGLMSAVVGYSLPDIQRVIDPAPIRVHSLTVSDDPCDWQGETYDGCVLQDRTVDAESGFFYAAWDAAVLFADTRRPVPGCTGDGSWQYQAGRATYAIPLPVWVGSDSCTVESLQATYPNRSFVLLASWHWGADQTTHVSAPFSLTP